MSRNIIFRLVVVLAFIVAGVFFGLRYLRTTVVVEKVRRGAAADAAPCTVTVLAERSPVVASEVAGRVAKSTLEIGRHVAEGDVLIEIDPTELKLDIEQNENDIKATKQKIEQGPAVQFDLVNERETLAGKEEAFGKGAIPAVEVDRQKRVVKQVEFRLQSEKDQLEQSLASQENALKVRQTRLEKMTIRAPIAGVITHVYVGVGDLIGGGAPIADMISDHRLVEARVSEENIKGLALGQHALVQFLPYDAEGFSATVDKILPAADPLTQRYVVYLKVQIDPERLIPGITGEAGITRSNKENALIIPRSALVGKYVFVAKNGCIEKRAVKLGINGANLVEVTEGLSEGEEVAVDGLDQLRDGDQVKTVVYAATTAQAEDR